MEEHKDADTGTANQQILDPTAFPQVHSGNNIGVPKSMVPPTYDEALASSRHITMQDSYISAVYAPPYPPPYACDHLPSRQCPFCSTSGNSPQNSRRACRPRRQPPGGLHCASCPRILLFSFVFMFFLIMTSVLYNVILVEPFFNSNWCVPPSCMTTTPRPK